jgi:exonuclease V
VLKENPWIGVAEPKRMVYIADVKTRGHKSVPAAASLKPTWMQLMLYRKLLEALATNTVDADTIFARYDLRPLEPFTETFITEIGRIDSASDDSMDDENPFAVLQASELESHGNLSALWSLMISEFTQTIDALSDVLRAEFRYSKTGELIGSEVFAYDADVIEMYIASEMSWWKGEREAVGVEIEEAFKCRMCDFAEECGWRKNKIEEATEKHRLRVAARAKSKV